jgi:hypothetical protein
MGGFRIGFLGTEAAGLQRSSTCKCGAALFTILYSLCLVSGVDGHGLCCADVPCGLSSVS